MHTHARILVNDRVVCTIVLDPTQLPPDDEEEGFYSEAELHDAIRELAEVWGPDFEVEF